MRAESITLELREKYTIEEKAEIADKLATAIADLDGIENDKSTANAEYNKQIKEKQAEIADFARKYNEGGELAQIGCEIRYDTPEPGKKSYFRYDNRELISTHDMSFEEKQETLQFPLAQVCEHPVVTGKDGNYTCDKCGKVLTEPPDMEIEGPITPPGEPGRSQGAGAN